MTDQDSNELLETLLRVNDYKDAHWLVRETIQKLHVECVKGNLPSVYFRAALDKMLEELKPKVAAYSDLEAKAQRVAELVEVVDSWKSWHREVSDAIGCQFLDRRVTLDAVRRAGSEIERRITPEHYRSALAEESAKGARLMAAAIDTLNEIHEKDIERLRKIETAAQALADKLDECKPHVDGAFQMAYQSRGRDYDGPSYHDQYLNLRDALGARGEERP